MEIIEERKLPEDKKRAYESPEIIEKKELKVDLYTSPLPDEPPPP